MASVTIITQQNYSEVLQHSLHPKQSSAAPAGTNALEEEDTHPIYNEAFHSLPVKEASPEGTQEKTPKSRPLKSTTITKIFHVPLEKLKYKEGGDQIKVCLAILKKTGAQLELSSAINQGLYINVSGTADVVREANRDIVSRRQIQESDTLVIPKEHHRFVIGKNGKVLLELELKTTTKIQIPGCEDPSNVIKISGTKEALEKAKHEILLITAEQADDQTVMVKLEESVSSVQADAEQPPITSDKCPEVWLSEDIVAGSSDVPEHSDIAPDVSASRVCY